MQRVDVLQSSRHVRVELNGQEIADTTKPRLLFETGLPVRTYIPKTDVGLDLLVPTELTTACPYKVRHICFQNFLPRYSLAVRRGSPTITVCISQMAQ